MKIVVYFVLNDKAFIHRGDIVKRMGLFASLYHTLANKIQVS